MKCTNLVDPHQLLCPWFTVVFVLFCIYTTDNLFPRSIVNLVGGLFLILSDSNDSKAGAQQLMGVHKVSAFHPFIFQKSGKSTIIRNLAVPRHFVAYLVFISSIRVDPGPRNRGPSSLLALKIRTLWQTQGN